MRKFFVASLLSTSLALAALPVGQPALAAPPSITSALKSAVQSDRELRAFYKARGHRPLWLQQGPDAEAPRQLIEFIATADLDGLDPERYRPRALIDALESASEDRSPKAIARAEMMLSRAFAAYVRDARRPALDSTRYIDADLAPEPPSPRVVLQAAAQAPSIDAYVSQMGWMHPIYAELRRGLGDYRYQWGGGRSTKFIPDGPLLKPGARGERVALLRDRFGLSGDVYDAELASALREFQAAHGLKADGVAGSRTLAALNEGAGGREDVIRLNMERARILPASGRHLVVDAASARLLMYEGGRQVDSMKVVVGKPNEQTPMLAGYIRYASLNPYWNLPPDLVRKRVAEPALKNGPSFVKASRFEVLSDWSEDAKPVDPAKVDWAAVASGRLEVPVRKLPGKDNAMGRVKFMLPNDLGIYLHDSPERELFAKSERRFSSGCVRLEDAQRLGKWLFGRQLASKSDAPEQHVNLPLPVPVFITYLTAAPSTNGIAFRPDAYSRDGAQLARLGGQTYASAAR